jgi:hypothetical protein
MTTAVFSPDGRERTSVEKQPVVTGASRFRAGAAMAPARAAT